MHENLRLVTYWNAPLSKLLLAKSNDYQGNESTYAHGLSSLTQNLCLKPLLHQAISLIKIPAARILTLSSTKNVSEQIKIPRVIDYSYFKQTTGFARAALKALELTESKTIKSAIKPVNPNITNPKSIW